jgi:glycerol kinase
VFEAMQKDSGVELKVLKVDGGMVVNETLMQFQADILGASVVRPVVTETTALGAAYAAGLAVGVWSSVDELREHWKFDKRWDVHMDDETRQSLLRGWKKGIDRTLNWVDDQPSCDDC